MKKKLMILSLVLLLILCCTIVSACKPKVVFFDCNDGRPIIERSKKIFDMDKLSGPIVSRTGYVLEGWCDNKECTGTVYPTDYDFSGLPNNTTFYAKWKALPKSLAATYVGETVYAGGTLSKDDFDVVVSYYDDTTQKLASAKFSMTPTSVDDSDSAEITISYTENDTNVTTVVVVSVNALEPQTLTATATNYPVYAGDEFDKKMLTVTVTYNSGAVETVSDYTVSGFEAVGTSTTFTISWNGLLNTTATLPVNVALDAISARYTGASIPVGLNVSKSDFEVTALYSDASSNVVTDFSVEFVAQDLGEQYATISYTDGRNVRTCEVSVTVIDPIIVNLSVSQLTTNMREFCVGDTLDDDMQLFEVVANFSDGNNVTASDFTVFGFDTTVAGDKSLTIVYCGTTKEVVINVKEVALCGISATQDGTVFTVGSTFKPSTLQVYALYNNGTRVKLASAGSGEKYTRSGFSCTKAGTIEGTVSYGGFSVKVPFVVVPDEIKSITASLTGTLYEGDAFNKSALEVYAVYDGNLQRRITDFTVSDNFDPTNYSSAQTVTITYEEKSTFTTTLSVTVTQRTVTRLVGTYNGTVLKGQQPDASNLTITATYSNGKSEEVTTYSQGTLASDTAGAKYLEISYSVYGESPTTCNVRIVVVDPDAAYSNDLSIHFLQLGNSNAGDSVYIKAGDTDILIDAGSRASSADTIAAYIDDFVTDGKLEYVIATHAHQDHIEGFVGGSDVEGILSRYDIDTIIDFARTNQNLTTSSGGDTLYGKYVKARNAAIAKGTNHYTALDCINNTNGATAIYELTLDGSITMEILYQRYYSEKTSNENNYSVCLMISQGDNNFLFTGDLEDSGEASLVAENPYLPHVKLYKGGHHGSYTAASNELLQVISPENVCVCCCAGSTEYTSDLNNVFPAQAFIDRVSVYTEKVYATSVVKYEIVNGQPVELYDSNGKKMYQALNGTIVVTVVEGNVSLVGSNNSLKLKDTQWFADYRTMPPAWLNGTSIYK